MTELETMERAKLYLDKLANGIDPLTDQPVADGDVINQVRISRCLFYVSDVLRKVIENGGITSGRRENKRPFVIDKEDLARVEYAQNPIGITELCKRITAAASYKNEGTLGSAIILNWLEQIGMLMKTETAAGKTRRAPTIAGNQLGISEEMRDGPSGAYMAVLYNEPAQRFIVDHLLDLLPSKQV